MLIFKDVTNDYVKVSIKISSYWVILVFTGSLVVSFEIGKINV